MLSLTTAFLQTAAARSGREAFWPYLGAALTLAVMAAMVLSSRALGHPLPTIPALFLPVLVGALLGGLRGGLFAMVLGLVTDRVLFDELPFPGALDDLSLTSPPLDFLAKAGALSVIGHWFRHFGQKTRAALDNPAAAEQGEEGQHPPDREGTLPPNPPPAEDVEYEQLFASLPIGLATVDRALRIVRVNRAWPGSDTVPPPHRGRPLEELAPELAAALAPLLHRALDSGEAIGGQEIGGRVAGDAPRTWRVQVLPLADGDGRPSRLHIALLDISGQKRTEAALRESEEKHRRLAQRSASALQEAEAENCRLIEMLADSCAQKQAPAHVRHAERLYHAFGEAVRHGVWISEPDGRVSFVSEAFRARLGLDLEQCLGWGWLDALHPDDRERVADGWRRALASAAPWECEYRCRGADGDWHPLVARSVPVRDESGALIGWTGVHLDRPPATAQDRKGEFLARLAHELRNPLSPILTAAQLLRRRALERPDLLESATGHIERQVKHLSRLIDHLSDIARVLRGTLDLKLETLAVDAVIPKALETVQPLLDKNRQTLSIELPETPLRVHADPARLAQSLGQILLNAAKFTPAEGNIQLGVRRDGHQAAIHVRDPGIGIDADALEAIFEPFAQFDRPLHPGTGNGLGLGLTLARGLLELQGGTLAAHSAGKGQGSEFVVRLPLAEG
ncbi:sensor histidine kinase [Candidatus Methylocalor cossyra]|uniref:histidine kinase n=1 Tax=Candidatus Methylocalor cossyra TaxID=3108543 RepID=A0ABP1CBH0_9GAMM